MGTIFKELIRKFNEALNENPGEHITPRDVVHLMVDLLLAGDEERLRTAPAACSPSPRSTSPTERYVTARAAAMP
ncbi:MAG: N-6 DNA methylase [Acidobacteria bacterium]|nr:N-6 DNA methylase [Acidobacteriota bacterium]